MSAAKAGVIRDPRSAGRLIAAAPLAIAFGAKSSHTAGSSPGLSTASTSSPGWITVSAFGTNPVPSRSTETTRQPSGSSRSPIWRPAEGASSDTSNSMISSCSWRRSSRCTSPWCGTSCSISRRIRSVADTTGRTPRSSKCSRLRGLLTRAIVCSTRYFSFAT